MSITITVKDIVNSRGALNRISSVPGVGAGMTLTLARVARCCDVELGTYSKALQDLQALHVRRDETGAPIVHDAQYEMDDHIKFDCAHRSILEQEVELPIGRVKLATLEREKAMPTAAEAAALWWLIVDLASDMSETPLLFDEL